jgi:hypothetical protein
MFVLRKALQENAKELDNYTIQSASMDSTQSDAVFVLLTAILNLDATRMDLRRDHM